MPDTRPQVNFRIDADLLAAIREKSAAEGCTVTEFFLNAARKTLGLERMDRTALRSLDALESLTARFLKLESRLVCSLDNSEMSERIAGLESQIASVRQIAESAQILSREAIQAVEDFRIQPDINGQVGADLEGTASLKGENQALGQELEAIAPMEVHKDEKGINTIFTPSETQTNSTLIVHEENDDFEATDVEVISTQDDSIQPLASDKSLSGVAPNTTPRAAVDTPAQKVKPRAFLQIDLATRLSVDSSTVGRNKTKSNFKGWSKNKDQDKVAWRFNPRDGYYYPIYDGNFIAELFKMAPDDVHH